MADTGEHLPKGKTSPEVAKAEKSGRSERGTQVGKRVRFGDKLEDLFPNIDEQPEIKSMNIKLTSGEEKTLAGNRRGPEEKKFSVVPLTYDQIVEGMLSVGIVSKILDDELYVSLPGGTGGTVSITNISSPYMKVLKKYGDVKKAVIDKLCVYPLNDLFQIGQQVVVKVIKVERSDTTTKVSLSMNPTDLHEFYSTTILKEDLVMIAAVESKEDHGYVMDVGINKARCFLPNDEVDKFISRVNNNRQFGVGQLVYCQIKSVQIHRLIANVTFTIMPKLVRLQKMDEITSLGYSTLIPGMLVDATVVETHTTGIMVYCMDWVGLVYQDHMSGRWTSPKTLQVGSTVPARILYTLPNLTSPYLTLQADLLPLAQSGDRTDLKKLGAINLVRIVRTEKRGVVVRFENNSKGLIPIRHFENEGFLTMDEISKRYASNSRHPCRVLEYSPIERMYICSLIKVKLESDVRQKKVVEKVPEKNPLLLTAIIDDEEEDVPQIQSGRKEKRKLSVDRDSDAQKENGEVSRPSKKKKKNTKSDTSIDTSPYDPSYWLELVKHLNLDSQLVVADLSSKSNKGGESKKVPKFVTKFESGEIKSPKDPNYWMDLMTHYCSVGNIDKARGVAKQALSSLGYRNDIDKLRVWGVLLYNEAVYGTEESITTALADALQINEEEEYLKMICLVYGTLHLQKRWLDFRRELLSQALSDVPTATKVFIITTFALFEIRQGEKTNGKEMFDHVLAQYPQRIDIWLLYVNALIKAGDNDKTRTVFHLAFEVKWSPRKLKLLLKRFQSFENEYGDDLTKAEFQNCALKGLSMSSKARIMEEAEIGMNGYAIIKSFNKEGVNVNAIGGVKGFIPVSKLNRVCLADFKEAHHVGQIIEYKVLEKVPEKNHLLLTAIIDDEDEESSQKRSGRKEKKKLSVYSDSDAQKENGEENRPSKKKKKKTKSDTSIKTSPYDPSHWLVLIKQYTPASQLVVAELISKSKTEPKKVPKFVTKFESGEITSPKDPIYWLALMTHYCSLGNADKARGVAKQALSSLDSDIAKLRVWGGLLYNEAIYGTEESMTTVLADTLRTNEEVENLKMISMVYGTLHLQKRWLDFRRKLLSQALSDVPNATKVFVITTFALFEIREGHRTNGEEMFDRVLAQYPRRIDIWLLYVNALIKAGDNDKTRSVFHRVFEVKWSPRKVKPLLQRFESFENKYGDDLTKAEFQNCALKGLSMSSKD